MPGLFTKYPPTAADLRFRDILRAGRSKRTIEDCLRDTGDYLKTRHLFPVKSGRAALYAVLKAVLPSGSKVIIPGYTCYTLAASVIKAGMLVILSDSDPADLGYDLEALKKTLAGHPDTKAIVVCHLFGIALDLNEIKNIAGHDILIIDDAAQAFGLQIGDRLIGSGGDCGFYSFGRGKPLSISGGGLLVTDNEPLANKIEQLIKNEFTPGHYSVATWIKAAFYNPAVHPVGFNLASRLPGIKLGHSIFDPEFTLADMSDFKVRLLSGIIHQIEKMNDDRQTIARKYDNLITGQSTISIPRSKVNGLPGNLRFPILIDDHKRREKILNMGRSMGFSAMYPAALNAIPQLPTEAKIKLPGAEKIARTIVTLPTHRYIGRKFQSESFARKLVEIWR